MTIKLVAFALLCTSISFTQSNEIKLLVKKVQSSRGGIYEGAHDKFYHFLQNSDILIDKSLFLKKLLSDHHTHPLILITAPCRFGKSTVMKMLEFFLQPELNDDGSIKSQHQTKAYQFFKEGKISKDEKIEEFTDKPSINQYDEFLNKHLGRYPVIFLNLLRLKGSHTYDEFIQHFKRLVLEVFREHYPAIKNVCQQKKNAFGKEVSESVCSPKDHEELMKIFNREEIKDLEECFLDLTRILKAYYENPVVILIDEYESGITKMYTTEGVVISQEEKQRIEEFYLLFLEETLINNKHVYKGFLTGILPLILDADPSGSNNIQHFRHTNKEFYPFYGFSVEEIAKLFEYKKIPPELASEAYIIYDGYHIENDPTIKIYNPWSIVKFVNSQKIDYYWAHVGGTVLKRRTLVNSRYEEIMMTLLADRCWQYTQLYSLPFSSLGNLEALVTSRDLNDFPTASAEIFLWFMSASGFLTVEEQVNGSVCMKIASNENRALITSTFFGTGLNYRSQRLAVHSLQKAMSNRSEPIGSFMKEYKDILLADTSGTGFVSHQNELWYLIRFLDVVKKTAMSYNYSLVTGFLSKKSKREQLCPDFMMYNETHGIIVEARCNEKKKLKEAIDEELLPHGVAFFENNPTAKQVRLIFVSIRVKSKKIKFTDFNYTSLRDIPIVVPSIDYLNILSM